NSAATSCPVSTSRRNWWVQRLTRAFRISIVPFLSKECRIMRATRSLAVVAAIVAGIVAAIALTPTADSACCYFSAKDKDVLQPSQKAFITWDPVEKVESFTVQPRFEGNAEDFGMVIPTPGKPKLDEMPRDFFKELAVYTILKRREVP